MTKTGRLGWCALTALFLAGLTACNKAADTSTAQTAVPASTVADSDPAAGNLAPVGSNAPQVAQNDSTNYGNSAPPPYYSSQAASSAPDSSYSDYDVQADADSYPADSGYDTSGTQVIEADDPPPPLPDYTQPEAPGDNYYWTPGYWSYASGGYYWVPGAWVMVPWVNALWTPPYWGYDGRHYRWHGGYWGPHVGFYGGIDYGFGYTGRGYYGAYWNNGTLNYNRAVMNVNVSVVHNVYNYSVPNSGGHNRVSYNGGRGGITARPTPQEMAVVRDPRTPPVTAQVQYQREAAGNRAQFASAGHAQPAALVAPRPLATSYREPAAKPPAAAMRMAAARTAPAPAPQSRPNEPPARPMPENRNIPENRPVPENRQPAPVNRPAPEARPAPQPAAAQRPVPENRPAPPAPMRPAPEARPAPEQRPAPQVQQRPAPQPAQRPAPETRPAPPQPQRPAPEQRPAPQVQQRPAPQPAQRPAPEVRPAPQQAQRPAPEARPAPQQAPRPAPESRPAPPAARPAPEAHPAQPQAHPAPPPQAHPAPPPEKKPEDKKEPPK